MEAGEVVGAIFPIPSNLVDRIFKQKRNIFVKVLTVYKDLRPGSKILFYASGAIRAIIGEGTAEAVALLSPEGVIRKHKRELFIDQHELREYVKGKPRARKLLVIPLRDLRLYRKPYKPKRFVTVAGQKLKLSGYEWSY